MQRSFSAYSVGVLAVAFAFTVTPVFAQETAVTSVTQQTQTTSQDSWAQKILEQYRAFKAKKQGDMNTGGTAQTASAGGGHVLGMKFWNASTSASTTECVQKAVDTRESALGVSWATFNTAVTAALLARQEALFDAWELENVTERNTALKAAWKTWGTSHKDAFKALKTTRNTTWKTYRTTMKDTCKAVVPREESLASDAVGSVSI